MRRLLRLVRPVGRVPVITGVCCVSVDPDCADEAERCSMLPAYVLDEV